MRRRAAFASAVDLPPGFSLAKVRILESDPVPRYWLSLNVYRVSGITTGLRAEWSTYVDDGSGTPRFMIVVARAADGSIDPIGPLAPPEPFSHSLGTNGVISTAMNKTVIQNSVPVRDAGQSLQLDHRASRSGGPQLRRADPRVGRRQRLHLLAQRGERPHLPQQHSAQRAR